MARRAARPQRSAASAARPRLVAPVSGRSPGTAQPQPPLSGVAPSGAVPLPVVAVSRAQSQAEKPVPSAVQTFDPSLVSSHVQATCCPGTHNGPPPPALALLAVAPAPPFPPAPEV